MGGFLEVLKDFVRDHRKDYRLFSWRGLIHLGVMMSIILAIKSHDPDIL
ncbi:hypothetical protein [Bosea minatitlanensis]|uniref:Transposase n=1 Tax=Bosea minatitlanensis TaxID=128782 RepID=A0ABW0F2C7_9HYPH|nr:hypothetical protein [Bosea minatitlanensis]MCT4492084.1 hypothetical protein [Bosea minatitlanensis]